MVWRLSCASEPVGWTLRDQEQNKGDLWVPTPAAQISGTTVQLRTVVVVGTVIMRVSRARLGQEAEGSTALWAAGTAVQLNMRAAVGGRKRSTQLAPHWQMIDSPDFNPHLLSFLRIGSATIQPSLRPVVCVLVDVVFIFMSLSGPLCLSSV